MFISGGFDSPAFFGSRNEYWDFLCVNGLEYAIKKALSCVTDREQILVNNPIMDNDSESSY